ncbi:hypothetical protein DQ397_001169 [Pseudomonas sp. CK-NBRI-02]|uniref:hypothetical protein n=1 Tax=Pseudomonas sp. CK-NBRI-02 TaxID=2249759 RepID=UPI0011E6A7A2|nr:hypothetical protein [Pseudomonas sp. CK-NBRI-02]TYO83361.1 hypothetical protein DQ397_001169 [Pseudomonas sp. CK-NBRI-02]
MYSLIETAQFRAMAALTGDEAYKEPAQRRANVFKNAYPLHLVKTPTGLQIQFSMIGAPNAYWTDTYPVTVDCQVKGKTVSITNRDAYSKKPLAERMILRLPVSKTPERCDVSVHSNVQVEIYSQTEFKTLNSFSEDIITLSPTASLQGTLTEENILKVSPAQGENAQAGEARATFDINRDVSSAEQVAFIIHTTRDSQLGIILEGKNGTRASSYYPILKAGRDNIVIFNKLGFNNGAELDKHIAKIMFRFYTKPNTAEFEVKVKEASVIRNTTNLESFLKRNKDAHFPQQ